MSGRSTRRRGGGKATPTRTRSRSRGRTTSKPSITKNIKKDSLTFFAALPSTTTSLTLTMFVPELPATADGWPLELKHLSIEADNESEVELEPIRPPAKLESIKFPAFWQYDHYEETLNLVSKLTLLQRVEYGLGVSICKNDIFTLLPRTVTAVSYNDAMCLDGCAAAKVDNLPDGVEELKFVLNNHTVTRWPSALRVLEILGDQFTQDISSLPDSVDELKLPSVYTRIVSKWPAQLKKIALGPQFFDVASIERLPAGVTHLIVSIFVARKLMSSGKLPSGLIRLELLGMPDESIPFDVRQLPVSVKQLVFDCSRATLVGTDERQIVVRVVQFTRDMKEADLTANAALLSDPRMAALEVDDIEETIGFIPKPENSYSHDPKPEPSTDEIASNQLFYTEPEHSRSEGTQYELDFHSGWGFSASKPPTPVEIMQRFAAATPQTPVNGVSFKEVQTPPLILALTDALAAGKISGPLALIECKCDYSRQSATTSTSGWRDGASYTETKPLFDMVGLEPIVPSDPDLMKDEKKQTMNDLVRLLDAMPQSKITRVKIETPRELFESQTSHSVFGFGSSSSSSAAAAAATADVTNVQEGFAAFCRSISRMPTLRTIVFRRCYKFSEKIGRTMLDLLVRTLLSSECAQIENLDMGGCELKENIESIVQLIRETRTLKHLVLSETKLTIAGVSQVAQAIAVNRSLVTINLAGNPSGVAGLNALRLALRENRSIAITVCHNDFGAPGIELLKTKRHARLKESNRIYRQGSISGWDVELL